jgi:hypothetical protein
MKHYYAVNYWKCGEKNIYICYIVGVPYSGNYAQKLVALFYGYFYFLLGSPCRIECLEGNIIYKFLPDLLLAVRTEGIVTKVYGWRFSQRIDR